MKPTRVSRYYYEQSKVARAWVNFKVLVGFYWRKLRGRSR